MKKFPLALTLIFYTFFMFTFPYKSIKASYLKEEKKIFLTFDDGPSGKVTEEVLDILKENNVKATFFLIGNLIEKNEALVLRMKNEGHSIGLHTFTHERNKIYKDDSSFLEENLKTQKLIENLISKKVNILRFPFGSNNNTYKLKPSLVDKLHSLGFKIYDWTLDSEDSLDVTISKDKIFKNSISDSDYIVLLMHCGYANKNSPKALTSIIKHYKEKGYSFHIIDENTEEIYKIKK